MRNAVVILAGGRATRLPGKLERMFAGRTLLERVYRNVREFAPVIVAGAGSFNDSIDAMLDCPIVIDRWPGRGPLAGLLSASAEISAEYMFAVAGDAEFGYGSAEEEGVYGVRVVTNALCQALALRCHPEIEHGSPALGVHFLFLQVAPSVHLQFDVCLLPNLVYALQ